MPTPDPIALPELPPPYQGRVVATSRNTSSVRKGVEMGGYIKSPELFTADQMRAYGQACVEALTPAPQIPEGMALVPEGWAIERTAANEVRVTCNGDVSVMAREGGAYTGSLAEYALYGLVSDMLSAAPSPHPDALPDGSLSKSTVKRLAQLNEPFGNSEQLASLEQRAHDLFWAMMQAPYADTTIGNIVCAETTPQRLESAWIPLITAALSAQPRGEPIGYIYPGDVQDLKESREKAADSKWRANVWATPTGQAGMPVYAAPQPREVPVAAATAALHELYELRKGCEVYGEPAPRQLSRAIDFLEQATTPQDAAGVEEMSPDFTDSARGAIAWVLYHHQGGSSPVGQPLRFALGMGAYDPLPDWRIAEAKRYATWAGASTERFHTTPPPGVDVGKLRELDSVENIQTFARAYKKEVPNAKLTVHGIAAELAAIIDAAAPGVGNG